MQERILGGNLKVSAVGLGCMGFSHAYGAPTEQKEAIYRLQQAVEMGFPNWWGDLPMPVYSFLEEYDFIIKIMPFLGQRKFPVLLSYNKGLSNKRGRQPVSSDIARKGTKFI